MTCIADSMSDPATEAVTSSCGVSGESGGAFMVFGFIKSKLDGNAIDILGASTSSGAALRTHPQKTTDTDSQLWQFVPDPDGTGYYFIQSKLDGNLIGILGASTSSGAALHTHPQKTTDTDSQLWEGAFPAARTLTFNQQHQQQDKWCWAATTVSISLFYDSASTWTQCILVNKAFKLTICCQDGASSACNKGWHPDQALTITGNLASKLGGKPSFGTIISEINIGHPVSVVIYWTGGGGHSLVIYGYDGTLPEMPWIDIEDPWYGPTSIPFNMFPEVYNVGGVWGYFCLTS